MEKEEQDKNIKIEDMPEEINSQEDQNINNENHVIEDKPSNEIEEKHKKRVSFITIDLIVCISIIVISIIILVCVNFMRG